MRRLDRFSDYLSHWSFARVVVILGGSIACGLAGAALAMLLVASTPGASRIPAAATPLASGTATGFEPADSLSGANSVAYADRLVFTPEPAAVGTAAATQPPSSSTAAATVNTAAAVTLVAVPTATAPETPVVAVRTFYELVQRKEFQAAERLWTQHMVGVFPPSENIVQRFSQTHELRVEDAQLRAQDNAAGRATVQVAILETLEPTGTRRYVGTWDLVRANGNWQLDQPDLQLE